MNHRLHRSLVGVVAGPLLLALAVSAAAADPPSARGTMTLGGERIALTHAVAVQRDNAEGLLESPNELRIALTDRELAPEQLWGLVFLPATTMAGEGKLRGLLIRVDPANRSRALVTLLAKPAQPGATLANITIESSAGALPTVKIGDGRVAGSIERTLAGDPPTPLTVAFSAPVLKEPGVTEDLRGAAAQSSPQVKTLSAAARALSQGDRAGQGSHLTAAARVRQDQTFAQPGMPKGAELAKMLKQAGDESKSELTKVQRVVVRGTRAVVLLGGGTVRTMALEDGAWKIDE
jgi:hypothetical protein